MNLLGNGDICQDNLILVTAPIISKRLIPVFDPIGQGGIIRLFGKTVGTLADIYLLFIY